MLFYVSRTQNDIRFFVVWPVFFLVNRLLRYKYKKLISQILSL